MTKLPSQHCWLLLEDGHKQSVDTAECLSQVRQTILVKVVEQLQKFPLNACDEQCKTRRNVDRFHCDYLQLRGQRPLCRSNSPKVIQSRACKYLVLAVKDQPLVQMMARNCCQPWSDHQVSDNWRHANRN